MVIAMIISEWLSVKNHSTRLMYIEPNISSEGANGYRTNVRNYKEHAGFVFCLIKEDREVGVAISTTATNN